MNESWRVWFGPLLRLFALWRASPEQRPLLREVHRHSRLLHVLDMDRFTGLSTIIPCDLGEDRIADDFETSWNACARAGISEEHIAHFSYGFRPRAVAA